MVALLLFELLLILTLTFEFKYFSTVCHWDKPLNIVAIILIMGVYLGISVVNMRLVDRRHLLPVKYAMIPINYKYLDDDTLCIRRVLISYTEIKEKNGQRIFFGTKLIDVDPYFKDRSRSHQYVFKNRYYYLKDSDNPSTVFEVFKGLIKLRRPYHDNMQQDIKAILFKTEYKQLALSIFWARPERFQ